MERQPLRYRATGKPEATGDKETLKKSTSNKDPHLNHKIMLEEFEANVLLRVTFTTIPKL